MNRVPMLSLFVLLFASAPCAPGSAGEGLLGFRAAGAGRQRELEARFDASLDATKLREWMQRMTVRPHHAGSAGARQNAEFIAARFREWGLETEIEIFEVLFPTPRTRELVMLEPEPFRASLVEEIVATDAAAAALEAAGLPPYNAYSADGDVTGELVYVNQGLPRDYEELDRRGIDVRGRIVIARYGGSWRGIKPKVAAERGAVGCILYNDPHEDGYFQGGVYPDGAFKPDTSVQRGSVVDLPRRPGDPSTPGRGGTPGVKRLDHKEAETVMTIPVLPISRRDALPLLRAIGGPVAPESWRGALPVTYRLGPGRARVRLTLAFDWDLVPAYNVIARITGSDFPDQWIIRGNHHDAWGIGATDPISGMVTVMEQARATAELVKTGWRPRRTLVFCAWDAEEPGLLGSVDWVEHHADVLREKAVAYINTDSNSRGFLRVGGSHALEKFVMEVARDVPDPQTDVSVYERLRSARLVHGTDEQKKAARAGDVRLNALGSGSDYSAFLQHLGVMALDLRFGGEGTGGEYHTLFDTFDHYMRFKDPTFEHGIALVKVCGRLMLRLGEADILPFEFRNVGRTIGVYVDEVVALADTMREQTEELNALIRDGHYRRALDPRKKIAPPRSREPVPFINFTPLRNAHRRLVKSAAAYDTLCESVLGGGKGELPQPGRLVELNRILYRTERVLIHQAGLPRRPWFRHQIYAPGYYTGYGVKTLPGVREGIEERQWDETATQIGHAAAALERLAAALERGRAVLGKNETGR